MPVRSIFKQKSFLDKFLVESEDNYRKIQKTTDEVSKN